MKISYAITAYNEAKELETLLEFLMPRIRPEEDEVVVLQDLHGTEQGVPEVVEVLRKFESRITWSAEDFKENFAVWKNKLTALCTGDYICQLDADECPNANFIKFLPGILEQNPEVDLLLTSRQNIVEGLTQEDVERWNWVTTKRSSDGATLVNWPDWQTRIYRKGLQWNGVVHEKIVGFKQYSTLPTTLYLVHRKSIDRQREQNDHYSKILENARQR